ncbi:MAG: mercuric reductase [Planctomycetota bacterium]|nr:mercuric reductase [Planctomycetota bacterium]
MTKLLEDDRYDRELRAAVAPRDWRNPHPAERYDLLVLGAGTAGLIAASIAAGLGARVALVEQHLMGGDCLNAGCVPSKALLAAAHRIAAARRLSDYGASGGEPVVDFAAVMERMRRLRAQIGPHDGAERFRKLGVDVFRGRGSFAGPDLAEVEQADGTLLALSFKRALIATGAGPMTLPVPGFAEADCLTNETLFALTELPRELVVVGAGPIGAEMAQAFARFGSKVRIVALDSRLLPREDAEAAALVDQALRADGVEMQLGAGLDRLEMRGGKKIVHWAVPGPGGTTLERGEVAGDDVLLALGRVPRVEGLGLEQAGVAYTKKGVQVDEGLRTTNPRIFAAGDVAGLWQFTHAADHMARIVIRNAFFFGRGRHAALPMSWCTYTDPEVAHVGLYGNESERAGCALEELRMDFKELDRAILEGETEGFAKIVIERESGKLRGATVAGPHAGEILAGALLPVAQGLKATALASAIHPYPTIASVWGRLGDAANRRRFTPFAAKLLGGLIRLRR